LNFLNHFYGREHYILATAFHIYRAIPFTILHSVSLVTVIVGYVLLFSEFCAEDGEAADMLLYRSISGYTENYFKNLSYSSLCELSSLMKSLIFSILILQWQLNIFLWVGFDIYACITCRILSILITGHFALVVSLWYKWLTISTC